MAVVVGGAALILGAAVVWRYYTVQNAPNENVEENREPVVDRRVTEVAEERLPNFVALEVEPQLERDINYEAGPCCSQKTIFRILCVVISAGIIVACVMGASEKKVPCQVEYSLNDDRGKRIYGGTNCPTPAPTEMPTFFPTSNSSSSEMYYLRGWKN